MTYTNKQIAQLKKEAHHLIPIFQIGKHGITEDQVKQIGYALEKRELIKVSVLQNAEHTPKEFGRELADHLEAELVQVIGRIIVLFRESHEPKNRKISSEL